MLAVKEYSAVDRFLLLLVGAFCLWRAVRGFSTGQVSLRSYSPRRSEDPLVFWFYMGVNILFGIVGLVGFILGPGIIWR